MGISGKKRLIRELPSKVIDMFDRGSGTPALLTLSMQAPEGYSSHFVCLSVCLSLCLSVCLFVKLSLCLSVAYLEDGDFKHFKETRT